MRLHIGCLKISQAIHCQSEQTALKLIQSVMDAKWPNMESRRFSEWDAQSEFDSLTWFGGEEKKETILFDGTGFGKNQKTLILRASPMVKVHLGFQKL